jgi:4-deoxy-L-threo-5-hexosulose-uronate ketol-isomerase
MDIHESVFPSVSANLSPDDLRREFHVAGLFQPGEAHLRYWDTDRTILGGICPMGGPLALPTPAEIKSTSFLERREAGIVNVGGPGTVIADGVEYRMANLDALYLGRGITSVSFASQSQDSPARFWMQSYPAHLAHGSRHVVFEKTAGEKLGSAAGANQRTLYKLIHPAAFPTCQVVMGVTRIAEGSVWNTMPPHTHMLRSEVYLYFELPPGRTVFHFMGQPEKTRHLVVRDLEAVLSPSWSIHCGAGTGNYSFVWGMGGENQDFADMQRAETGQLL